MAKRGSPALYELIRARGSEPAAPSPPSTGLTPISGAGSGLSSGGEPHEEPLPGGWLRPGRLLRIPLGYVFVAVAAAIVLCSLTYMAGFSRGKHESRILYEDTSDRYLAGGGSQAIPRDPLESRSNADTRPSTGGALANHGAAASDRRAPRWGPIESDPRERGLNYLMLVTTNRAGAERVANFARERGLETYVIPTNNARLFRVFALPGFESSTSEAATAHREDALRIGEMYRVQYREGRNPFEMSEFNQYVPRQ